MPLTLTTLSALVVVVKLAAATRCLAGKLPLSIIPATARDVRLNRRPPDEGIA